MNFLLIQIPKFDKVYPPLGLAYLKSALVNNGHNATIRDLNIQLDRDGLYTPELDYYFQLNVNILPQISSFDELIQYRDNAKSQLKENTRYTSWLHEQMQSIDFNQYSHVGISVFSMNSIMFLLDLIPILKHYMDLPIVLGGMGLTSFEKLDLSQELIDKGFVTNIILGEGEQSILELDKLPPRYKSPQINELDKLHYPQYEDLNLAHYQGYKRVNLTGSRGCVKNCSFCDVPYLWPNYRWRSAENIVGEIEYLYNHYGFENFDFTDSLINGNLKNFRKLTQILAEKKLPITIGGQFICRPAHQFDENDYKLMQEAGFYKLSIGVESGSSSVLKHMGKKLDEKDYDYMFQMLNKYNIRSNILLIVGYPTETQEDFQKTLDMLTRYKIYNDSGSIASVSLGKTLVILPNTPLHINHQELNIELTDRRNWICTDNLQLTVTERYKRRITIEQHCRSLGYVISQARYNAIALKQIVDDGFQEDKLS